MVNGYYPRRNDECFSSSVVNLLIFLGDTTTAKRVFENYPNHPLVLADGRIYLETAPRLLSDLTNGNYEGVLFKDPSVDSHVELIKKNWWTKANEILRVIEEENKNRQIRDIAEICSNYRPPAVLFVKTETQTGHAIVDIGNNEFINDGKLQQRPFSDMPEIGIYSDLGIFGILYVHKSVCAQHASPYYNQSTSRIPLPTIKT